MEGLAAAGGVIAVVSLAGQVLQGCSYLRGIFEEAVNAPKELRLLAAELGLIERIVNVTLDADENRPALDFCNEAVEKLRNVVDKYAELDKATKTRKWGSRLSMALNGDKISKYLGRLREATKHLQNLQNTSAHNQTLVVSKRVLESVHELSASHAEAATIISRMEGRVDEINSITNQTNLYLHELANRFANREDQAMLRVEGDITKMMSDVETVMRYILSDHRTTLPKLSERCQDPSTSEISTNSSAEDGQFDTRNWTCDTDEFTSSQKHALSAIDQRIAELSTPASRKIPTNKEDSIIRNEKSSKATTQLGEILMRTTRTVYSSIEQMMCEGLCDFQESPIAMEFPVTVTSTDILLVPRSWNQKRGATIQFHQVANPKSICSNIFSFEMEDFTTRTQIAPRECSKELQNDRDKQAADLKPTAKKRKQKASLLMRTAFKIAIEGYDRLKSKRQCPELTLVSSPRVIVRNSFDKEVDDAMELVNMWLSSGMEAGMDPRTFQHETFQVPEQHKMSFVANFSQFRIFIERLRIKYTQRLLTEIVTQYENENTEDINNVCLDHIHEEYWTLLQTIMATGSLMALRPNFSKHDNIPYLFYQPAEVKLERAKTLLDLGEEDLHIPILTEYAGDLFFFISTKPYTQLKHVSDKTAPQEIENGSRNANQICWMKYNF